MEHDPIDPEIKDKFTNSPQQVILFMGGLIFLGMMLGSGIIALACNVQGIDFQDTVAGFGTDAAPELRNFMRGALLINHMLTFLIPAMLTGFLFFRQKWPAELGIRHAPAPGKLALGVGLTIMAFPLAQLAFMANRWLVSKISWLDSLVQSESASEDLMEGLLVMASPMEMVFSLLVMAVVPAIGEEMVFRGILQKQMQRLMANPYVAILATALLFGLAHFQIQRFFAIFMLGAVLGLLFHWTKNLWVPIAGHFVFNGTQVVAAYFGQDELEKMNDADEMQLPTFAIVLSIVAVVFLVKKLTDK